MAKRKRKQKKAAVETKRFVKYEIFGLIILSASGLGLAGAGSVGKLIDYFFILLAGNWYYIPLLYVVYVAIYIMIRRSRPAWTRRKIGLLLLVIVLLTWSHLNLYRDITSYPSKVHSNMLQVTKSGIDTLYDSISKAPVNGPAPRHISAGGGFVGYLSFSATHVLFDTAGTIFILILTTIASLILITKKSLVQILSVVRAFLLKRLTGLRDMMIDFWDLLRIPPTQEHRKSKKKSSFSERQHKHSPDTDLEVIDIHSDVTPITIRDFADTWGKIDTNEQVNETSDIRSEVMIQTIPEQSKIQIKWPASKMAPLQDPPTRQALEDVQVETEMLTIEDQRFEIPPLDLLNGPSGPRAGADKKDMELNAQKLKDTLASFGVQVTVNEAHRGPTVTRYELQPAVGVKVSRIVNLSDDLALALAAKDIRIEAPIPGKAAVGIEVPNREVAVVTLREVMEAPEFSKAESKLTIAFGRDISGAPIIGNLAKMPHVLVAGATGSGKSVCINGIITSIMYKAKPHEVKFIMIDPKMVELNVYNGIPHLMAPVVTDPRRAAYALKKVVQEMEHRYECFAKEGTRNLEGYNTLMIEKQQPPLPLIVVIIDELADLMMVAPGDVEDAICRLAQMARAAGIHLILATQRPSVDVITGVIKANIPSRIAFAVSSQTDSRTILDMGGAEKLLGRGDMLYLPVGESKPIRIQGAFLSDTEVERLVAYAKNQQQASYHLDLSAPQDDTVEEQGDVDALFWEAVNLVVDAEQASVSLLQRKLRVGYARAARLVDQMEERGVVGPFEGSKPREVRISREQLNNMRQQGLA